MAARAVRICASSVLSQTVGMLSRAGRERFVTLGMASSRKFSTDRAIMSKAFIQKPAPAFSAKAVDKTGEFVDIKLSDYKGKYLVLFFYPLDFNTVDSINAIKIGNYVRLLRVILKSSFVFIAETLYHIPMFAIEPRNSFTLSTKFTYIRRTVVNQILRIYRLNLLKDFHVSMTRLLVIPVSLIVKLISFVFNCIRKEQQQVFSVRQHCR
ncbi:oxire in [Paramuricea clavata]|uniref:thioredoxin-dependent peroxiredoxin n=1 Tax=Paramuricea clavata TaxID=317549 RepID=A0A6S7GIW9_PARCT|nr:oxire in [Paramuricea clavata]